jgi:hypothetical protein
MRRSLFASLVLSIGTFTGLGVLSPSFATTCYDNVGGTITCGGASVNNASPISEPAFIIEAANFYEDVFFEIYWGGGPLQMAAAAENQPTDAYTLWFVTTSFTTIVPEYTLTLGEAGSPFGFPSAYTIANIADVPAGNYIVGFASAACPTCVDPGGPILPQTSGGVVAVVEFKTEPPGDENGFEGAVPTYVDPPRNSSVPEPSSLAVLCSALGLLFLIGLTQRRAI